MEQALHDAGHKIEQAVAAFLHTVEGMGIQPELFEVGRRQTGRKPLPRFGHHAGYWGFHGRAAPTEPIFEPGFTVHEWKYLGNLQQRVLLWQSAKVELRDFRQHKYGGRDPLLQGALPFYLSPSNPPGGQELEFGAVHESLGGERQIQTIMRTADWFVAKLAAYLADEGNEDPPRVTGSASGAPAVVSGLGRTECASRELRALPASPFEVIRPLKSVRADRGVRAPTQE